MLHGMCGHPENECSWFAGAATRDRFVVCPRADLECNGGGYIWSGKSEVRNDLVRRVRERVECAFPDQVSAEGATLVGFSLGGFVALDVAEHSRQGEWPHVLLIGARVTPSRSRLDRAGVASLLFASGDWDMSRPSMRTSARLLARSGLRADYVGLGPIGHWFARDMREMDDWLEDALGWLDRG
jgi:pimeloyl-ACP methyl ester carboxylesterase